MGGRGGSSPGVDEGVGNEAVGLIAALWVEHQRRVGGTRLAACDGELHVHRVDDEGDDL